MEKTIITQENLHQFLKAYSIYYDTLGEVPKDVTHALFTNKCYTFEKAVEDSSIRSDLQDVVESTWRISHDEDTVIAILQKLDCEVI